jgi:TonB family protein
MVQLLRCFTAWSLAACAILSVFPALASSASLPQAMARPSSITITGRVANTKGVALAGVFITVQESSATATTNSAGNFLLAIEQTNPVLTFKCAGYQTQAFRLKAIGPINVILSEIGTVPAAQSSSLELVSKAVAIGDEPPTFPGGTAAYRTFLQQNVRYPDEAKANNISGDVFVSFVVDEMGRLLDAEVIKGVGYGLDEEALRLIRLMPWWTPAKQNGKAVRVPSTLRIRFGGMQQPATASQP